MWTFSGPVREAVHDIKYRELRDGARRLAPALAGFVLEDVGLRAFEPTHLVPVPLHRWRQRQRGFNQSEVLARALGFHTGLPCARLLRRVRATTPQVRLSGLQRRANVRGAFALDSRAWRELNREFARGARAPRFLLVDDVFTTGATLEECARELRRIAGARVAAVTLAR